MRSRTYSSILLSLASGLFMAGCGTSESADSIRELAVRDSAGITIVENPRATEPSLDSWQIDPVPIVRIGVREGPPEYMLHRVLGAGRLSDGRIIIADGGTRSVRVYDAAGVHLASFGRSGAGPGEFRSMTMAILPSDSIVILDVSNRRISVLDAEAGYARSFPLPGDIPVDIRGVTANNEIVARTIEFPSTPSSAVRDSVSIVQLSLDGTLTHLRRVPARSQRYSIMAPPSVVVASTEGFWFGSGDDYEVALHGGNGEIERIARWDGQRHPVSDAAIARMRANASQNSSSSAGVPEPEDFPAHYPPYQMQIGDSEGNLWLWTGNPEEPDPFLWTVIDREGTMRGQVATPTTSLPYQIGDDFVLTRYWDELMVEEVHLYRLIKGRVGEAAGGEGRP